MAAGQPAKRVMGSVWCFTSATLSYLDRVRVLGATLRRQHPEWTFCLCLADEPPARFELDLAEEPIDVVVRLTDLAIPQLRSWIFMHDQVELCTAVKGAMVDHLFQRGAAKVVYLDPDIAVLGGLGEIETLLDRHDVVLTPHLLQPETAPAPALDHELSALKHGIYNLGFLAVANTEEGRRFARWWSERLLAWGFDDIANGLFTDQRWCDHAPVFFPSLHVLRDPGYNVASWNVAQRQVTIEQDGTIRAAGHVLRFFHFSKVQTAGGPQLDRMGDRQPALLELLKWYLDRLEASAAGVSASWWAFGHYADGVPISRLERVAYRHSPSLQARFPDPFSAGADALLGETAAASSQ
jgi:hypothetical protein